MHFFQAKFWFHSWAFYELIKFTISSVESTLLSLAAIEAWRAAIWADFEVSTLTFSFLKVLQIIKMTRYMRETSFRTKNRNTNSRKKCTVLFKLYTNSAGTQLCPESIFFLQKSTFSNQTFKPS